MSRGILTSIVSVAAVGVYVGSKLECRKMFHLYFGAVFLGGVLLLSSLVSSRLENRSPSFEQVRQLRATLPPRSLRYVPTHWQPCVPYLNMTILVRSCNIVKSIYPYLSAKVQFAVSFFDG